MQPFGKHQPILGGDDFCWSSVPASQAGRPGLLAPPQQACGPAGPGRASFGSGAAALSAQLARTQATQQPSSFEFMEEGAVPPPEHSQLRRPLAGGPATAAPPQQRAAPHSRSAQAGVAHAPPPPPPRQQQQHQPPLKQAGKPPAALNNAPPAVSTSLSLEAYLDFRQHLTKGAHSVQQLSELEKSVLKMNDLKQILLVQGCGVGGKARKDVLDALRGLDLADPTFSVEEAGGTAAAGAQAPTAASSAAVPAQPAPLDAATLDSLGWTTLSADQLGQLQQEAQAGPCCAPCYACCPLPAATIRFPPGSSPRPAQDPEGWQQQQQQQLPVGEAAAGELLHASQMQPAPEASQRQPFSTGPVSTAGGAPAQLSQQAAFYTSSATEAGAPAQQAAGPWSAAGVGAQQGGEAAPHLAEQSGQQQGMEREWEGMAAAEEQQEEEPPPAWLEEDVGRIAEASQGSLERPSTQEMLGRKVAFVLLEDFSQGDAKTGIDTVFAGVHEGQVVEHIREDEDEDIPPGQTSWWYYVRVPAGATDPPAPSRRPPRRLDLGVELAPASRVAELEGLLGMGRGELQDAWVLLEPRSEAEGAEEGAPHPAAKPSKKGSAVAKAAAGRAVGQGRQRHGGGGGGGGGSNRSAVPHTAGPVPLGGRQGAAASLGSKRRGPGGAAHTGSKAARLKSPQQQQQQGRQAGAGPARLVWANVCGVWWPAQVLEGALGGGSNLRVEVFGCNIQMTLAPNKVTAFAQDRATRLARQQHSELGRQAVQRALELEGAQ